MGMFTTPKVNREDLLKSGSPTTLKIVQKLMEDPKIAAIVEEQKNGRQYFPFRFIHTVHRYRCGIYTYTPYVSINNTICDMVRYIVCNISHMMYSMLHMGLQYPC